MRYCTLAEASPPTRAYSSLKFAHLPCWCQRPWTWEDMIYSSAFSTVMLTVMSVAVMVMSQSSVITCMKRDFLWFMLMMTVILPSPPPPKRRGKRKRRKRRKVRTPIQRRAAPKRKKQLLWPTRPQIGAEARIDNLHYGVIRVSQCQWPLHYLEVSWQALQHLLNANADFVFVTKTHFTPDSNPWKLIHGAIFSTYAHKQRGCALIPTKKGVSFSNTLIDPEGRWIVATVHSNHFPPLRLCGIYALNTGQDKFIHQVLSTVASDTTILIGDFNFITQVSDRSLSAQLDTIVISCLSDISPVKSPHNFIHRNGQYTACLDRCYIQRSPHISASFSQLHRFPTSHHNISDYIPTVVHLLSPELIPRGSPFWRLNTTRINPQSVNILTHALAPITYLSPLSILNRWEGVKDTV